jgi:glucose-1-phosphate thymidylyltransferase
MRAIIPVAGFGSRLRPHTYTLPKVLLNVAGKPILGHILDKIIEDGFTEATIIVGHLGDQIREYVTSNYSIKFDFIEQAEPQGLAHAIYLARDTFSTEPMLIILGDTIFDVNLTDVIGGQYSSIGVKKVADPRRFGVVEVGHEFVTQMIEKPENPTSNLAIVGLYWIKNPSLLDECIEELFREKKKTRGEYQLTDALQLMVQRGEKLTTFLVEGWYDCGKPETLLATNRHLLETQAQVPDIKGIVVHPPVFIAKTATISNSIIGPYATIAEGAVVSGSIIRNSIVSNDAHVHSSLLEDSIVGMSAIVEGNFQRVNIGDSSEIKFS